MAITQRVLISLGMNTRDAQRASNQFWSGFTRLARQSAGRASSPHPSGVSIPQLGSQGGGLASSAIGAFAGPVTGTISAGVYGALERMGTAAFKPIISAFDPLAARNTVAEQLQPIAEAQALATGNIDKQSLSQLNDVFLELETRKRKGKTELNAMLGKKDAEDTVKLLQNIFDLLKDNLKRLF